MVKNKILVTGDFDIPSGPLSERIVHLRTPRDDLDIISHLKDTQHYVIGGPEYLDDNMMAHAPNLKHVVVMGTGTNSFVDLHAAQKRGIAVNNTPGINADSVAEYAVGMIITNLANSFHSRQNLLEGGWYQTPHKTLSETKLGIIGLGDIGKRLAKKVRALSSAEMHYFSRTRKPDFEAEQNIGFMNLRDMVNTCDVVVLSVTYNPGTHKIVNADLLEEAKPGLMLLNFSNPLTVDPRALKSGLEGGKVGFAYFDGYYNEWTRNKGSKDDEHGLLGLGAHKFVATSHIAAQSHAVISRILEEAFSKISKRDENAEVTGPYKRTLREKWACSIKGAHPNPR